MSLLVRRPEIPACDERTGQRAGHEQAMRILLQPAIAHLGKAEHAPFGRGRRGPGGSSRSAGASPHSIGSMQRRSCHLPARLVASLSSV